MVSMYQIMQKRINDFDGILRIIGNQNSLKQKVKMWCNYSLNRTLAKFLNSFLKYELSKDIIDLNGETVCSFIIY